MTAFRALQVQQTEVFFTEGSPALKERRAWLAQYSLARARERVASQARAKAEVPWADEAARRESVLKSAAQLSNDASEVADERPVACCAFTADGSHVVTGGWSGAVKVWSVANCQKVLTIKAHEERITGLDTNPNATMASTSGPAIATAAADRTARLWTADGRLLGALEGHEDRLGRVVFHPSGALLATASFDQTWRLWDLERAVPLLAAGNPAAARDVGCLCEQEGHSRSVYSVAFQGDGALLASGGLDAIGRVWDLRTGRSIVTLEGHTKPILALDFSPDGYHLVTGSEDNTCQARPSLPDPDVRPSLPFEHAPSRAPSHV